MLTDGFNSALRGQKKSGSDNFCTRSQEFASRELMRLVMAR